MTKAETWRLAGLAEHSSVAAFGRVALELMAVGAPGRLVAGAHQAAIDEVARLQSDMIFHWKKLSDLCCEGVDVEF